MLTKVCSICKTDKPVAEFYKHKKNGYQAQCKSCQKAYNKKWKIENRSHLREYQRNWTYDITTEAFEKLKADQGNRCFICEEVFAGNCVVDHNHSTGEVRGLLCQTCNQGIGLLKDSPTVVRKALEYLEAKGHYGDS